MVRRAGAHWGGSGLGWLRLLEVLAQGVHLPLVGGPDGVPVQPVGLGGHAFEGQLGDPLPMLDRERHVMGSNLKRCSRAEKGAVGIEAESGIEESRIVGSEL